MELQQRKVKRNKSAGSFPVEAIVLYADPLCCWSYAFLREFHQLVNTHPLAAVRLCIGGLLPAWDNYYDRANEISRPAQMGPLWMQAAELTGIPFNSRLWSLDPPASSYPAGMAVKCAALQSPSLELPFFEFISEAALLQGQNTARPKILRELGEQFHLQHTQFDPKRFHHDMTQVNGLEALKQDIRETRNHQINRFPSLILTLSGRKLLISGYKTADALLEIIGKAAQ